MMAEEPAAKRPRKLPSAFSEWSKTQPWLVYDEEKQQMHCQWCRKHRGKLRGGHKRDAWVEGVQRFKLQGVEDHEKSKMHAESTAAERVAKAGGLQRMFARQVEIQADECDEGMICETKALYWLAKEDLAMEKLTSQDPISRTLPSSGRAALGCAKARQRCAPHVWQPSDSRCAAQMLTRRCGPDDAASSG